MDGNENESRIRMGWISYRGAQIFVGNQEEDFLITELGWRGNCYFSFVTECFVSGCHPAKFTMRARDDRYRVHSRRLMLWQFIIAARHPLERHVLCSSLRKSYSWVA